MTPFMETETSVNVRKLWQTFAMAIQRLFVRQILQLVAWTSRESPLWSTMTLQRIPKIMCIALAELVVLANRVQL